MEEQPCEAPAKQLPAPSITSAAGRAALGTRAAQLGRGPAAGRGTCPKGVDGCPVPRLTSGEGPGSPFLGTASVLVPLSSSADGDGLADHFDDAFENSSFRVRP